MVPQTPILIFRNEIGFCNISNSRAEMGIELLQQYFLKTKKPVISMTGKGITFNE
jgi:hypothetical protein